MEQIEPLQIPPSTMWLRLDLMALVMAALCQSCRVAYAAEPIIIEDDHPILNDPEALQAMEIFMGMSPEEREDTIRGLLESVGDDPKARAEMELIISKLPALDAEQVAGGKLASDLKQMVQDDQVAKARQNAKKQWTEFGLRFSTRPLYRQKIR